MIKAVLFDMDGLLLDSERIALATFQQACDERQLGDQRALYDNILGTNTQETHRLISHAFAATDLDADHFMTQWMGAYRDITTETAVPLMAGVIELLDFLKARNITTAVTTSTDTSLARDKLQLSAIEHYFHTIIGGDQISNSKPAPDIYLRALDQLKLDPETTLALEDSPNGVRAAVSAQLTVVQIPDLLQPDDTLLALGHHVMSDLHQVKTWLQSHH